MAHLDAFSAQIVKFVREMPDEALLELVKQKLGVLGIRRDRVAAVDTGRRAQKGAGKEGKKRGAERERPARPRRASPAPAAAERQGMIDSVEQVVKSGAGMSASEVARTAGIPQTRAAAALKELKLAKKIFQGGDRRFARYAGDAKTAEQASAHARKTAKGPTVPGHKNSAPKAPIKEAPRASTRGHDGISNGKLVRVKKRAQPSAAAAN